MSSPQRGGDNIVWKWTEDAGSLLNRSYPDAQQEPRDATSSFIVELCLVGHGRGQDKVRTTKTRSSLIGGNKGEPNA